MLDQIVLCVVSCSRVDGFGLEYPVCVIRPPRGLRDAPSSNYPRQVDFTFEGGGGL